MFALRGILPCKFPCIASKCIDLLELGGIKEAPRGGVTKWIGIVIEPERKPLFEILNFFCANFASNFTSKDFSQSVYTETKASLVKYQAHELSDN